MEDQKRNGVVALDMISKLCSTFTTMPMLGVLNEFKIPGITQVRDKHDTPIRDDFDEFASFQSIANGQVGHPGQSV